MNTAFYTAVSGMRTFQSALDITANNMANVNTTAYKAERGAFQDLWYTQMDVNSAESYRTRRKNERRAAGFHPGGI